MFQDFRHSLAFRVIAVTVMSAFLGMIPLESGYAQVVMHMPPVGEMVHITSHFEPAQMVGLRVDVKDPFQFYFVMDKGQQAMSDDVKKAEYEKLIKYFLASLTTPNNDMWVNLSPHESTRIMPDNFAQTEMGRDLLAQDYVLKQLSSSLMYPEDDIGKKFWARVYAEAQEKYGTTDIPIDTFNKVWITADTADLFQKDDTVFVVDSRLKVMLEQDFMAVTSNKEQFGNVDTDELSATAETREIASKILREIIIPIIEREVNEGESFAIVRQTYGAMILATWFKRALKESLLGQVYADQSKMAGIEVNDPQAREKIYQQYLEAYKVGVFNFIKEDVDPITQEILPRKYFSGGIPMGRDVNSAMSINRPGSSQKAMALVGNRDRLDGVNAAMATDEMSGPRRLFHRGMDRLFGRSQETLAYDLYQGIKQGLQAGSGEGIRNLEDVFRVVLRKEAGSVTKEDRQSVQAVFDHLLRGLRDRANKDKLGDAFVDNLIKKTTALRTELLRSGLSSEALAALDEQDRKREEVQERLKKNQQAEDARKAAKPEGAAAPAQAPQRPAPEKVTGDASAPSVKLANATAPEQAGFDAVLNMGEPTAEGLFSVLAPALGRDSLNPNNRQDYRAIESLLEGIMKKLPRGDENRAKVAQAWHALVDPDVASMNEVLQQMYDRRQPLTLAEVAKNIGHNEEYARAYLEDMQERLRKQMPTENERQRDFQSAIDQVEWILNPAKRPVVQGVPGLDTLIARAEDALVKLPEISEDRKLTAQLADDIVRLRRLLGDSPQENYTKLYRDWQAVIEAVRNRIADNLDATAKQTASLHLLQEDLNFIYRQLAQYDTELQERRHEEQARKVLEQMQQKIASTDNDEVQAQLRKDMRRLTELLAAGGLAGVQLRIKSFSAEYINKVSLEIANAEALLSRITDSKDKEKVNKEIYYNKILQGQYFDSLEKAKDDLKFIRDAFETVKVILAPEELAVGAAAGGQLVQLKLTEPAPEGQTQADDTRTAERKTADSVAKDTQTPAGERPAVEEVVKPAEEADPELVVTQKKVIELKQAEEEVSRVVEETRRAVGEVEVEVQRKKAELSASPEDSSDEQAKSLKQLEARFEAVNEGLQRLEERQNGISRQRQEAEARLADLQRQNQAQDEVVNVTPRVDAPALGPDAASEKEEAARADEGLARVGDPLLALVVSENTDTQDRVIAELRKPVAERHWPVAQRLTREQNENVREQFGRDMQYLFSLSLEEIMAKIDQLTEALQASDNDPEIAPLVVLRNRLAAPERLDADAADGEKRTVADQGAGSPVKKEGSPDDVVEPRGVPTVAVGAANGFKARVLRFFGRSLPLENAIGKLHEEEARLRGESQEETPFVWGYRAALNAVQGLKVGEVRKKVSAGEQGVSVPSVGSEKEQEAWKRGYQFALQAVDGLLKQIPADTQAPVAAAPVAAAQPAPDAKLTVGVRVRSGLWAAMGRLWARIWRKQSAPVKEVVPVVSTQAEEAPVAPASVAGEGVALTEQDNKNLKILADAIATAEGKVAAILKQIEDLRGKRDAARNPSEERARLSTEMSRLRDILQRHRNDIAASQRSMDRIRSAAADAAKARAEAEVRAREEGEAKLAMARKAVTDAEQVLNSRRAGLEAMKLKKDRGEQLPRGQNYGQESWYERNKADDFRSYLSPFEKTLKDSRDALAALEAEVSAGPGGISTASVSEKESELEVLRSRMKELGNRILVLEEELDTAESIMRTEMGKLLSQQKTGDLLDANAPEVKAITDPFFAKKAELEQTTKERDEVFETLRRETIALQDLIKQQTASPAESAKGQAADPVGGINLDDENLTINIKVDGAGMPLPLQFQDPAMINIQGLTPVIREIAPVNAVNIPVLSELLQTAGSAAA